MRNRLVTLLVLLPALLLVGCGTLDKTGVYAGDEFLYDTDRAIGLGYETIHSLIVWETANHEYLKANAPDVVKAADKMRSDAPMWFASAYVLRDAYVANPSSAGQTSLKQVLAMIRAAMQEAVRYTTQTATHN